MDSRSRNPSLPAIPSDLRQKAGGSVTLKQEFAGRSRIQRLDGTLRQDRYSAAAFGRYLQESARHVIEGNNVGSFSQLLLADVESERNVVG